ncbi:hypothetical protein [Kitasatospora sp. NPDC088783]|uniref:hypothetical protein n=1 Tax=Kitasatospora sp. NPDC088783 TaxID=3364077 RepID=UPI0038067614
MDWSEVADALDARVDLTRSAWSAAEEADDRLARENPKENGHDRRAVRAAMALSRASDAALLSSARWLLQRRADGRSAPRRLLSGRLLPGRVTPGWWCRAVFRDDAGIWRLIPDAGPEERVGLFGSDAAVLGVTGQALLLQASLQGYLARDDYYEAYVSTGRLETFGQGPSVPAAPGLSPKANLKLWTSLRPGLGIRVRADMTDAFDQAFLNQHAVWERARDYAAAVAELLRRAN